MSWAVTRSLVSARRTVPSRTVRTCSFSAIVRISCVSPRAEARERLELLPGQNRLGRPPREWRVSRQHLVEHTAETIEIAAAIELLDPPRLLRAHVPRGAHRDARPRYSPSACHSDRPGDTEVAHHRMTGLEQDVLRLDVAMHDVATMGVVQGVRHLAGDVQRVLERELALVDQAPAQRA